jgi:hypothetical protein
MDAQQNQTKINYRPILRSSDDLIDTFRCRAFMQTADGEDLGSDLILGHKGDIESTAERNAAVLKLAFKAIRRMAVSGQDTKVFVPINSVAMASRKGAAIIYKMFEELEPEFRKVLSVWLFNLPQRVSVDSLSDMTIPFLPFTDRFFAEPHEKMEDYTVFTNCNYSGVTIDAALAGDTVQDRQDRVTDFWSEAAPRRLGIYIQNIEDDEIKALAVRIEASGMDGPAIAPDADRPGPVTSLDQWPEAASS